MGVPLEMNIVSQVWSEKPERMPALFLDRDGTLIEGRKVFSSIDEIRLLPRVSMGLKKILEVGYLLIVVTNQPNIEKAINTMEEIRGQNERLRSLLAEGGVLLDAAYTCPHTYPSGCKCRKPELGMIEAAQKDFSIDMGHSWFVGDTGRDMETARRAGISGVRVESTNPDTHFESTKGDFSVKTTAEALELISARMVL